MVQALRKPANLPYPRLPAPIGPNFKEHAPPFLKYRIGSNLVYKQLNTIPINTERPHKIHFKVIGLIDTYKSKVGITMQKYNMSVLCKKDWVICNVYSSTLKYVSVTNKQSR